MRSYILNLQEGLVIHEALSKGARWIQVQQEIAELYEIKTFTEKKITEVVLRKHRYRRGVEQAISKKADVAFYYRMSHTQAHRHVSSSAYI